MARRACIDLLAQLPDEDVHGSVASREPAAPDPLQQFVPGDDPRAFGGKRVQEPELGRCELCALPVEIGLHADGVDSELFELDQLAAISLLVANPTASR